MKKRIMLQKANKILAAVMTASMLTSSIVPGAAVYAAEISVPEMGTEDGFTDGTGEETPVVTQNQEEAVLEFDDGSVSANEEFAVAAESADEKTAGTFDDLKKYVNDSSVSKITLTGDIKATDEIKIYARGSLTIDLAGHKIEGSGSSRIFYISSGATVTITSSNGMGLFTNGYAKLYGGAIFNNGITKIENIEITGNHADSCGGGVDNVNGGSLKLENVNIHDNTTGKSGRGGGIYSTGGSLELENVNIYNNSSGSDGGGICIYGGSLELKNVEIKNNTCVSSYSNGGGAYTSGVSIVFKDKIVINNNTVPSTYYPRPNLYLSSTSEDNCISIDKPGLAEGSDIKVSASGVTADGKLIVKNFNKDYLKYFSPDDSNNQILGFKDKDDTRLYIGTKDADLSTKVDSHVWEYTADDGKITFKCVGEDGQDECDYKEPHTLLQLNAGDMVYSGESQEIEMIPEQENIEALGVTVEAGKIKYKGSGNTEYSEKETAPTNAGTYTATLDIKIGEETVTVTKEFQIAKAVPEIHFNDSLSYSGDKLSLVSEAPSGMKVEYQVNGGGWSENPPVVTDAGTYTVEYKITGDANHKDVAGKTTVTVEPARLQKVEEHSVSGTYNGDVYSATVSTDEDATVEYRVTEEGEYTAKAPEFIDAGEYPVYYRITKKNYQTVTGTLTVKISPKEITVKGITAENKDYDGNTDATLKYDGVEFDGIVTGDTLTVTATGTFESADSQTGTVKVNLSKLVLGGDSAGNYTLVEKDSQKDTEAWIRRKWVTVSITPNGGIYGGEIKAATAKFNNLVEGEQITPVLYYSGTADNGTVVTETTEVPTNAGTYIVEAINESANYYLDPDAPNTAEFKIAPKTLTKNMVTVNAKAADEPEIVVEDTVAGREVTLEKEKDYTVELSKEDGISTAVIKGKGNYTGTITKIVTAVEKPETGKNSIITSVTSDDESIKVMKPVLEPVSVEDAKELLNENLKKEEAKNIVAGTAEGAYDATVDLEMQNMTDKNLTPETEADIEKVEELIKETLPSGTKIGKNLDLKLYLNYKVTDAARKLVESGTELLTDTGNCKEEITITIPEDLKPTSSYTIRTYYVICVHNGVAEVVPSIQNGDKLTFTATKFSTYTIAYSDTYYSPSYPVTGIKVSTDKAELTKKGETVQIKAEITPSYADNKDVTWKSSDESVATVDKDGNITAVGNGTATITVTTVSGNYTATVTVIVNIPEEKPEIDKITISSEKETLTKIGESTQLNVKLEPENAKDQKLTWKSSDESIVTVDADGKVTAVGNGTATITVTTEDGKHTATATITVKTETEEKPEEKPEIDKITVSSDKKILTKIGESTQLHVKVEPENAKDQKLTWKSGNEKVATVDANGRVTAVGNGTATITVTTEDGRHSATITVTVKVPDEPAVTKTTGFGCLKARSVTQTNNSVKLEWNRVSGADGYIVYGNLCNSNGKTYKYQKLATITNSKTKTWTHTKLKKGTFYKYLVKAYKVVNGKKVITDTSVSIHAATKGGKYGVAKSVSVTKVGTKKNTLTVTLKKGQSARITAKEVKMDKKIKQHRALCYESSNKKVASVTADGQITAAGKGTCSIWVYAQNGVYKTITVTVK